MNLLFITRKYPPSVGGMQALSAGLAREFSSRVPTRIIAWKRGQKYLPYFLIKALMQAVFLIPRVGIDHVHLGDGLMAPLGVLLKLLFRIPVTVTINGTDIMWGFGPYQLVIPRCLARLDRVVCASDALARECIRRGVPAEKCAVVANAVHIDEFTVEANRSDLGRIVGRPLEGRKVLVTVGRLIDKKGVGWFVERVLPRLPKEVIYVIVGDGPERTRIERAIRLLQVEDRVILLGSIPHDDFRLKVVYNTADLFVMPNIPIKGATEGFGLVAVEAAAAGLPVVASRTGGIPEVVIEGQTGHLVESASVEQFVSTIRSCLDSPALDRHTIRAEAARRFSWEAIGNRYISELDSLHDSGVAV